MSDAPLDPTPTAQAVAARRCAFFGSDRAHFGYGPPLVHAVLGLPRPPA
jgi:hypothetical protein